MPRFTPALASALVGLSAFAGSACAQQSSLKEQIVGVWTLVVYDSIGSDGIRKAMFGTKPVGFLVLDPDGHYTMTFANSARPKQTSNVPTETTQGEYVAAAQGLVAQYGDWLFDEASTTLTTKVRGSLNPNLAGVEQKVGILLAGDELIVKEWKSAVTGGVVEQVFRRAK